MLAPFWLHATTPLTAKRMSPPPEHSMWFHMRETEKMLQIGAYGCSRTVWLLQHPPNLSTNHQHHQGHHSCYQDVSTLNKSMVATAKRWTVWALVQRSSHEAKTVAGQPPKTQGTLLQSKDLPDGIHKADVTEKTMAAAICLMIHSLP